VSERSVPRIDDTAVDSARERDRLAIRLAVALTLTALALLAPRLASAQDWRTFTAARSRSGEEVLRVNLEYGAGRLNVGPGASGTLYRTNMRYDAELFQPRVDYSNTRLHVGIQGQDGKGHGHKPRSGHLDLRLAPDVPLDLELKFGATEANLELGGLRIRRGAISTGASKTTLRISRPNQEHCQLFELHVGAARFHAIGLGNLNAEQLNVQGGVGEVILDFTGRWRSDLSASVQMGLGALMLHIPRGLGLRVSKDAFFAPFDSQELIKRGNAFYSQNWDDAEHKLSLDIDAAFGSIKVVWVD
jgi:N-terminal domain of toast_rack, DUF2154